MKTIERPSQKLIDVVLKVAEGEARDKATPGMTYDGTATIFKLYHGWAEQQAALASLLPAAVKALEAVETSLVYYRDGGAKANGILKTERDAVVTALEDLMKWQVTPMLQRISEATKAVGE